MRVRRTMDQDEYVRHIWYTQSRWGIRRRNRIILWSSIAAGAVIVVALILLLR